MEDKLLLTSSQKLVSHMKYLSHLVCLFILLVVSCKDSSNLSSAPIEITNKQSDLISSYTSGVVGIQERIIIRFTKGFATTPNADGLLDFEPSIKGSTLFIDKSTLVFEPGEKLERGQSYLAMLNLESLFPDLEDEDQIFEFSFSAIRQHFSVDISGLLWDNNEENTYKFEGVVRTNDFISSTELKKCFSINQPSLKIKWQENTSSKSHSFVINNIKKGEDQKEIKIDYSGKPIDLADLSGTKTKTVPAVGDFNVMDLNVTKTSPQQISITFSEKLDPQQDLLGLINIKDYEGELDYKIVGNTIRVFPKSNMSGKQEFVISRGVKNDFGNQLKNEAKLTALFDAELPQVALLGKGVIVPESEGMMFPFKAVNLRAVDVEIFKIFDDNILQYFQDNYYENKYPRNQHHVGRIIQQTSINLKELNQNANQGVWRNYAIDLSDIIQMEKGAIYEVRLSFRQEYGITECTDGTEPLDLKQNAVDENKNYSSWSSSYYGRSGYYDEFYQDRDNPCKGGFYNSSRFIKRKIYSSNLGVLAKKGDDGSLFITCLDLRTAQPISNASVDIFDFQQQKIRTANTNGNGMITLDLERDARFVVANHNGQKGILALKDGWALSMSNFDVSGAKAQGGLKGTFYAERGVWRPGDDIYLNFVLEDTFDKLPDNHPVSLRFIDPKGNEFTKVNTVQNVNGIYPFMLNTDSESPTGNWRAELTVGTATFSKNIKVETVKPNRLKIKYDLEKDVIPSTSKKLKTEMSVNWLVGTKAKNAKATVEMQVKKGKSSFEKYDGFTFMDPTRTYQGQSNMIFDGKTNEEGKATITHALGDKNNFPGMMSVNLQTKAFEPGGDFSIDNLSIPYSPFSAYVGVKLPKTDYGADRLIKNEVNKIRFVNIDESGKAVKGRKLKAAIYRLDWRWWWNRSANHLSQYNTADYSKALKSFDIAFQDEVSTFDFEPEGWGRYLIRICDEASGHCAGKICYAGWPYGDEAGNDFATMLTLGLDKEEYETGDPIKLSFPSSAGGKALVSIENGTKVLQTYWVDTEDKKTEFSFIAEAKMAPSIYAHVSYIQPHAKVKNDLPIRMYGVSAINVYDKSTKISPVIATADHFEPEEKVSIQVSEQEGREMTYTLAVVDEGLLDLTRFKTPDLWDQFYRKEALGVKTWDLYDYVMGSFAGQMDRILSIGGDGDLNPDSKKNKANRFEPVVQHFGPFYLKPGNKKTHEFTMPNYIGSVRVMLVAAHDGAYGKAEETVPVKKPLMVLSSFPRVLSPTENMQLPISVFALEDHIKNVKVTIQETEGLVKFPNGKTQQVSFSEKGEQMAYFDIEVLDELGVAKFDVVVESGGERSSQQVEIQVDNPNEYISKVDGGVLKPGETWDQLITTIGTQGTNDAVLEVYNIPPLNLERRLQYLLRYPHGCLEQTVSTAFPLLYLDRFVDLTKDQKDQRETYINAAIHKLSSFLNPNGAFSYWPNSYINYWANTYAGHFLIEAEKLGYVIPTNLISNWLQYQKTEAVLFRENSKWSSKNNNLTQAYRLYTLALAGQEELGAMNRLRQVDKLSPQASWKLSSAYALASRPEVAKAVYDKASKEVSEYDTQLRYNFGSRLRDQGMLLENLVLLKNYDETAKVLNSISKSFISNRYYNTHAISMAMLGVGKLMTEKDNEPLSFTLKIGAKQAVDVLSKLPISVTDLQADANKNERLIITNTTEDILFVRMISTGKPLVGPTEKIEENLQMNIEYLDANGKKVDITKLKQSADIFAKLTVTHPGTRRTYYHNLALTQIFPSGWEVINDRLSSVDNKFVSDDFDYQDIRDDRIHTYFSLQNGKSKTFYTRLTATYQGNYYLPNQICKAMYDESIQAILPSQRIQINR